MSNSKEQKQELLIRGPAIDERHYTAIRITEDTVSLGTVSSVEDYSGGAAELVEIEQIGNSPIGLVVSSTRIGPARVNNSNYRRGWDNIFGVRPEVGRA